MLRHAVALLALTAGLAGCSSTAEVSESFEAQRRRAEANLDNEIGSDYDRWLGQYFEARPEVGEGLTECFSRHPERPPLRGYIAFASDASYRLVLYPGGTYADCVAEAFAGFRPPPPPSLPYLNPFDLGVGPAAPRD
jgi:hypothetical protein